MNTKIKFSDYDFSEIIKIDDFNESMSELQTLIGVTDGGVCSIYWSGKSENDWINGTKKQRLDHIKRYINLENSFFTLKTDKFDYEGWVDPITVDVVKSKLIECLLNDGVTSKKIESKEVQEKIDESVNQIMYGLNESLNYFNENYQDKIDDVMSVIDESQGW